MKKVQNKENEPNELEAYIKKSLSAIKKGVEGNQGFSVNGLIEFDLAITKMRTGEGKFKIFVADLKGIKKSETISRLKFRVKMLDTDKKV